MTIQPEKNYQFLTALMLLILLFSEGVRQAEAYCWATWGGYDCDLQPCGWANTCNGFDPLSRENEMSEDPQDLEALEDQMCPGTTGDPVSLETGQFLYNCRGLQAPGKIDLDMTHTYSSGSSLNGAYGYGWVLNYHMRLHRLSNGKVAIVRGNGIKTQYTLDGSVYVPPPGWFETLKQNPDNTWTLTFSQGTRYDFDALGRLITIKDRNDNVITLTYDPAGKLPIYGFSDFTQGTTPVLRAMDYRLTAITDTTQRTVQLNYDDEGRLDTIADGTRVVKYGYDPDTNDLLSVTLPATAEFPEGVTKRFLYDGEHNVKHVQDARGQFFVENIYDEQGRVKEQILGGSSILLDFSVPGQVRETDRNGNETLYAFDDGGNIIRQEIFTRGLRLDEPESFVTQFSYNSDRLKISETFPRGNGITYLFDETNPDPRGRGNLLQIRRKQDMDADDNDTLDIVTPMTYESQFNLIKTLTDAKGYVATMTYDYELDPADPDYGTNGNMVVLQMPEVAGQGSPVIETSYNEQGQIRRQEDANENVTEYTYYPVTGYLETIIQDPEGLHAVTRFTYDTWGNIESITDAENRTTNFKYDALGWLIEQKDGLGYLTKYWHDANGNVRKIERQADEEATIWQTTEMTYDVLNHLKTVKDPRNRVTTYNYDRNENLGSVVDAEQNTTSYAYDERDLLFTVTDANTPAGVTRYDYDGNGNLARITDAENNETTYMYDLFDRLETTMYADLSFVQNQYDKNSNLDFVTLPGTHGTIDYVYDELNRLINKNFPSNPSRNITYAYDLGSRMTDANNAASQIHFEHNSLDRVETETQTLNVSPFTLNYLYYKNGVLKQITYPSTKTVDYTYDLNNQLDLVKVGGVILADYNYDVLSRRKEKILSSPVSHLSSYQYDIANQLSSIANTVLPGTNISTHAYPVYDAVGNRKTTQRTLQTQQTQETQYTYNDIYELTSVTGAQTNSYDYDLVGNRELADGVSYAPNSLNQYSQVDNVTFTYDDNGNLTSDGERTFTYDEENKLTTFANGIDSASYTYDALNRRVSKTVNEVTTYFIYDGDSVIAEYDNIGALQAEYVLGDNIDEILTMEGGADTYYYFYDGLGSVTEITDSTGAVVENYAYDPYGSPLVINSVIGNRYRFTGREFDEESGLSHYRHRNLHHGLGRFMQRDPMEYEDGINLFTYVHNDPVNFTDPFGLTAWDVVDVGFFVDSLAKFSKCKTLGNFGSLALDAISLLPIIPSIGYLTRADDAIKAGKKITTVIGSRADTLKYVGKEGYSVLNIKKWTPAKNIKWLDKALERGDNFKMVTDPIKHQKLMQKLNKPSSFLDIEIPYLLEKGIIPKY